MKKTSDNKDKNNSKKIVTWGNEPLKQRINEAIHSGNSLNLYNEITTNPSYKDSIKNYLTESVEGNKAVGMQVFFGHCDKNIKMNKHNSEEFHELLFLFFKEIDFVQTKIAFESMRQSLKKIDSDYSPEIIKEFNEAVEQYTQELALNSLPNPILKRKKTEDFSTEENEAVESSNPTKKARIEEHDEHSLTIEQKIEERKAEEQVNNNLGYDSSTNQRAILGPMTRSLDTHEKKNSPGRYFS